MSTLQTRKPTGKPAWPITLIAGAEKAGKSWACAEASASPLIGRTLWVGVGEDDPDEYILIPGANFEIVTHEGTYRSILNQLTAAVNTPHGDKPTLLVVDSMTRMWNMIVDDVQEIANERARRKAQKYKKPIPVEDVQISMDLWNLAKQRWGHVMDTLRAHAGPVLVTARLEHVTVMDDSGKPTTDKVWKVQAEKSLPFDVGAIVELPERGQAFLTGVRSARMPLAKRTALKKFTVHALWESLGLAEGAGERSHSGARAEVEASPVRELPRPERQEPAQTPAEGWREAIEATTDLDELRNLYRTLSASMSGAEADEAKALITARAEVLAGPPVADAEVVEDGAA